MKKSILLFILLPVIILVGYKLYSFKKISDVAQQPETNQISSSENVTSAKDLSAGIEAQNINTSAIKEGDSEALDIDHRKFFEDDLVQGNKDAKVVLVEYFSMTCPHCAHYHKTIYPIIKEKYIDTGKIAYVQREIIGNKQDFQATILARCAPESKRLAFYDVLLLRQDSWAYNRKFNEIITNIGQMGGVSADEFQKCLNDEKIGNAVMNNTKLFSRTPGLVGTPVIMINNNIHTSHFSLDSLSSAIDNELKLVETKNEQN
jgi:protein-disulfide isomerase